MAAVASSVTHHEEETHSMEAAPQTSPPGSHLLDAESSFRIVSKGSARIPIASMKAYLREQKEVQDELIDSIVAGLDINGDGEIDLDEWTQGYSTIAPASMSPSHPPATDGTAYEPQPLMTQSVEALVPGSSQDKGLPGTYMYRYPDGAVYEGEYKAGKIEGRGVFRYASGDVYEGVWKSGVREGQGTYRYASNAVYEGQYKRDQKEGRGTFRYADGGVYEGGWKAGQREGQGAYRFVSGDVYEGEYKAGQEEGLGTFRYADGAVYEGEYIAGQREGRGTFRHADGGVYEGEYKLGQRQGRGMFRYADGHTEVSVFDAGVRVGEGVRLTADTRTAWRLQHGQPLEEISIEEAKRVIERLALPMPLGLT